MDIPRNIKNTLITVDDSFRIEVEPQSWNVWHNKKINDKKTGEAKLKWTEMAYCRDLPAALHSIMRIKTAQKLSTETLDVYLEWYNSTVHSMLDRLLRKDTELRKALDENGVMVSYHNLVE